MCLYHVKINIYNTHIYASFKYKVRRKKITEENVWDAFKLLANEHN